MTYIEYFTRNLKKALGGGSFFMNVRKILFYSLQYYRQVLGMLDVPKKTSS